MLKQLITRSTSFLQHRKIISLYQKIIVCQRSFAVQNICRKGRNPSNDDKILDIDDLNNDELKQILPQAVSYLTPEYGHKVFVIQPVLKRPGARDPLVIVEHQLEEACALVRCLPGWTVADKVIRKISSKQTAVLFSSGNFEDIKQQVARRRRVISAVFFSIDMLNSVQLAALQTAFSVPVYDRFSIVLLLFKLHAQTREAKLQVALAELPYYKSRLKRITRGELHSQNDDSTLFTSTGSTSLDTRRCLLETREKKIVRELEKIKNARTVLRKSRLRNDVPIIAVVGYTNAGKTSLIKALTADKRLQPEDKLFATLDVTNHGGVLNSLMKVIYVDTVGFIADIPTNLIASFSATLEDALNAHVIIHVRDVSHPDHAAQKRNVLETLSRLDLPQRLQENVVEVANKIDKLSESEVNDLDLAGVTAVSSETGFGMAVLMERIERAVMTSTDRLKKTFRVPTAGAHLSWLYRSATVTATQCCPKNTEYLLVDTILSRTAYRQFVQEFGTPTRKTAKSDSVT